MTKKTDNLNGDKSVENGDNVEIIPPEGSKPHYEQPEQQLPATRLTTVGQVKTEMGKVYRKASGGAMEWTDASRAIFILRGLLKALEIEHEHNLTGDNPDEDRPVLTGLQIVGPKQLTPPTKTHDNDK